MKRLISYILAYFVIAAATAVSARFFSHTPAGLLPPNSVTVITSLSHDQLAAKLQQAGLQEANLRMMIEKPAPLTTLVFHFAFYAVILGAFVGLTHLFQRTFRTDVPRQGHAAS